MLHGTPTRAAHREAADGGLALLARTIGTTGHHRHAPATPPPRTRARLRRRAPREPERAAQFLTTGLAALIVLALTGLIGFFIVAEERRGSPAGASATPQPTDELGSRAADPAPLTLQEVFPDPAEVRPAGKPAYRITMTHIDNVCRTATTGTLGAVLEDRGCTQVVRASMAAPYGGYEVTAGLFNLADAAGAAAVEDRVRKLVETGDGSFAAMAVGELGTDPATPPTSLVGWHNRGHYLLYCVITRPDGRMVPNDDPTAARITTDLVDDYLNSTVLGRRRSSP
jgi:hypothetical protein